MWRNIDSHWFEYLEDTKKTIGAALSLTNKIVKDEHLKSINARRKFILSKKLWQLSPRVIFGGKKKIDFRIGRSI